LHMYKRIQRWNTDDLQVLDDESSAMMVIVSVIITAIITPTVTIIYRPGRRFLITNREQFRGQNQMQSLGYYYVYTLISTSQQSIISWKPPTQLKGPPCVSMWST
jgi:hypothetical protein